MTQEDKDLLLKDLCARLPYNVICEFITLSSCKISEPLKLGGLRKLIEDEWIIKPYLRPMSSMTKEEGKIFNSSFGGITNGYNSIEIKRIDWLIQHHFDYRELIGKGLALEAPKDMYV